MFQELTGLEYLQAEIACKHDKAFEKALWDERIVHFKEIDFTELKTFTKASDPIGLRAAHNAYTDVIGGKTTGYTLSLDASSSGLQLLSLLVSCPDSFNLCGGNSQLCVDSYTTIYDSMNLHGALTRKEVKDAIMTSLYGSVALPEQTFGDNVELFYDTMEDMAPGAWDLNQGLQQLWNSIPGSAYYWTLPDNFHAGIETKRKELVPFKFLDQDYKVPVKVDERPDFHKGLGPNLVHSVDGFVVREMFRRCMFNTSKLTKLIEMITKGSLFIHEEEDSTKLIKILWDNYLKSGFLSCRILELLDSSNINMVDELVIAKLLQSLPEKSFELVSVHDCFRCHPNYGNDLRRQYNTILADINDSTLLEFLATQVVGKKTSVTKTGVIPRSIIIDSNYALT